MFINFNYFTYKFKNIYQGNNKSFNKLIINVCLYYSDFDVLKAHDIRGNCKIAFDAGEVLGISRVIEPSDMDGLTIPDKLAVMTYLYQLRAHFTGRQ